MFGLLDSDIATIKKILEEFPEVKRSAIFGSRAKGNYRNGSDVDIAILSNNLSLDTILTISSRLNEDTLMPYRFDVLNYQTIANKELIQHIDRVGKVFFEETIPVVQEPDLKFGGKTIDKKN